MANPASAVMWNIQGMFDDGDTFSGSFDFDQALDDLGENPYSNVFITTTGDNGVTFDTIYDTSNDAIVNDSILFGDSFGFTIEDDTESFELTINFVDELTSGLNPISIDVDPGLIVPSQEEEIGASIRSITSGTATLASTAVPFEFSPTSGLLLVGGIGGVLHLRKRAGKIK